MDDQTKALVDNALNNYPNASVQVINVNTPGTVIVIGGNYFANGSKKKQVAHQKEEKAEPSVESLDAPTKQDDVVIDSTPGKDRPASTELREVEESVVEAARKILAQSDNLINSFAEKQLEDIENGISQKRIAQQIITAADANAIDSILDRHFPDAPF